MKTTVITVTGPSYVCVPTYSLPIGTIVRCKDKHGESEFELDYEIISDIQSPAEYVVETVETERRFWQPLKFYDKLCNYKGSSFTFLNLDEGTYYIIEPD